jgi:hypothetical protein
MTHQTPSERLLARLRALGLNIPKGMRVARSYVSPAQRSAGAWVWHVESLYPPPLPAQPIGSQWRVTDLLREPRLSAALDEWGQWSVDPAGPRHTLDRGYMIECPGDGPLRHADCTGCDCGCHWRPGATVDEIMAAQ